MLCSYAVGVVFVVSVLLWAWGVSPGRSLYTGALVGLVTLILVSIRMRHALLWDRPDPQSFVTRVRQLPAAGGGAPLAPGRTHGYLALRGASPTPVDAGHTIPRLIFRSARFPLEEVPAEVRGALTSFEQMHPEFVQVYLSDDDLALFIAEYYPQHAAGYHSLIPGAFRCDVARLMLLHQYGGFYSDIGHMFLQPIGSFVRPDRDLVLVAEIPDMWKDLLGIEFIHNAFMGATRGHPSIAHFISCVMHNVTHRYYGKSPLDITGPVALGRAFADERGVPQAKTVIQESLVLRVPHIVTTSGTPVISWKFPNYVRVMYGPDDVPKYSALWWLGIIYV